jgi:preprotein translocase subunit YajC
VPVHPSWIIAASTASKNSGGGSSIFLILLIGAFGLYMFTRSSRNKAKKVAATRSSIEVGAQVMTTSGIYATVIAIDDDSFELEVADGVVIRFAKAAVARVVTPTDAAVLDEDEDAEPADEADTEPDTEPSAAAVPDPAEVEITPGFADTTQSDGSARSSSES